MTKAATAPTALPGYVRADGDWQAACEAWLGRQEPDAFPRTNADKLRDILRDAEAGARMLVNMGAFALLRLLAVRGRYLNRYDLARLGQKGTPPDIRKQVDALIAPGQGGENIYFGAAGLEGCGIRFYGEYCLVLKAVAPDTQIFERDSYELAFEPLSGAPDLKVFVTALKGKWGQHLEPMAVLKTRELLPDAGRLVTEGRFRDVLVRGEEFIEVHRQGTFEADDLREVRQAPEDEVTESRIERFYRAGVLPKLEELVWQNRRARVEFNLAARGVPTRVARGQSVR